MWKSLKGRLLYLVNKFLGEKKPEPYRIPRFISEDSILLFSNNGWYIGSKKLSDAEIQTLREEAKDFDGSLLWRMMRRDVHYLAYLQSTAKRATEYDALYGGAMYKDLEILEQFIKRCKSL